MQITVKHLSNKPTEVIEEFFKINMPQDFQEKNSNFYRSSSSLKRQLFSKSVSEIYSILWNIFKKHKNDPDALLNALKGESIHPSPPLRHPLKDLYIILHSYGYFNSLIGSYFDPKHIPFDDININLLLKKTQTSIVQIIVNFWRINRFVFSSLDEKTLNNTNFHSYLLRHGDNLKKLLQDPKIISIEVKNKIISKIEKVETQISEIYFKNAWVFFQRSFMFKDKEKTEMLLAAAEYHEKAANLGHVEAAYCHAIILLEISPEHYQEKIIKWLTYAVDRGHTEAMVNLGIIYQSKDDRPNATKYFRMAIDRNNIQSFIEHGEARWKVAKGNKKILIAAAELFTYGAMGGSTKAMNNLNEMRRLDQISAETYEVAEFAFKNSKKIDDEIIKTTIPKFTENNQYHFVQPTVIPQQPKIQLSNTLNSNSRTENNSFVGIGTFIVFFLTSLFLLWPRIKQIFQLFKKNEDKTNEVILKKELPTKKPKQNSVQKKESHLKLSNETTVVLDKSNDQEKREAILQEQVSAKIEQTDQQEKIMAPPNKKQAKKVEEYDKVTRVLKKKQIERERLEKEKKQQKKIESNKSVIKEKKIDKSTKNTKIVIEETPKTIELGFKISQDSENRLVKFFNEQENKSSFFKDEEPNKEKLVKKSSRYFQVEESYFSPYDWEEKQLKQMGLEIPENYNLVQNEIKEEEIEEKEENILKKYAYPLFKGYAYNISHSNNLEFNEFDRIYLWGRLIRGLEYLLANNDLKNRFKNLNKFRNLVAHNGANMSCQDIRDSIMFVEDAMNNNPRKNYFFCDFKDLYIYRKLEKINSEQAQIINKGEAELFNDVLLDIWNLLSLIRFQLGVVAKMKKVLFEKASIDELVFELNKNTSNKIVLDTIIATLALLGENMNRLPVKFDKEILEFFNKEILDFLKKCKFNVRNLYCHEVEKTNPMAYKMHNPTLSKDELQKVEKLENVLIPFLDEVPKQNVDELLKKAPDIFKLVYELHEDILMFQENDTQILLNKIHRM